VVATAPTPNLEDVKAFIEWDNPDLRLWYAAPEDLAPDGSQTFFAGMPLDGREYRVFLVSSPSLALRAPQGMERQAEAGARLAGMDGIEVRPGTHRAFKLFDARLAVEVEDLTRNPPALLQAKAERVQAGMRLVLETERAMLADRLAELEGNPESTPHTVFGRSVSIRDVQVVSEQKAANRMEAWLEQTFAGKPNPLHPLGVVKLNAKFVAGENLARSPLIEEIRKTHNGLKHDINEAIQEIDKKLATVPAPSTGVRPLIPAPKLERLERLALTSENPKGFEQVQRLWNFAESGRSLEPSQLLRGQWVVANLGKDEALANFGNFLEDRHLYQFQFEGMPKVSDFLPEHLRTAQTNARPWTLDTVCNLMDIKRGELFRLTQSRTPNEVRGGVNFVIGKADGEVADLYFKARQPFQSPTEFLSGQGKQMARNGETDDYQQVRHNEFMELLDRTKHLLQPNPLEEKLIQEINALNRVRMKISEGLLQEQTELAQQVTNAERFRQGVERAILTENELLQGRAIPSPAFDAEQVKAIRQGLRFASADTLEKIGDTVARTNFGELDAYRVYEALENGALNARLTARANNDLAKGLAGEGKVGTASEAGMENPREFFEVTAETPDGGLYRTAVSRAPLEVQGAVKQAVQAAGEDASFQAAQAGSNEQAFDRVIDRMTREQLILEPYESTAEEPAWMRDLMSTHVPDEPEEMMFDEMVPEAGTEAAAIEVAATETAAVVALVAPEVLVIDEAEAGMEFEALPEPPMER
jgi:hypothetical protein